MYPAVAGAAIALFSSLGVAVAWGAVEGSPHDLASQEYLLAGTGDARDKCLSCHIPVVGGDQATLEPPPSLSAYSRSGMLCASCHDGTSIVNREVDASLGAFHPRSHTLLVGEAEIPNERLAENGLVLREGKLECVTCHRPHDNTVRPFMRIEPVVLCTVCHAGKESTGYGRENLTGSHPVHESTADDGGLTTPITVREQFNVPFPPAYPPAGGRNVQRIHWTRGGHLLGGTEGTVECFTCHAVHGTEDGGPLDVLLSLRPVRWNADEFCEGCHSGERGDAKKSAYRPNPGGTTTGRTYHPCDDDESNGTGEIVSTRIGVTWPRGEAPGKPLLCSTCHIPHNGLARTAALRRPSLATTFCEECHLLRDLLGHHPALTDPQRQCRKPPEEYYLGEGTGEGIYCYSCHVAHNAGLGTDVEADFIPILRFSIGGDWQCLVCHPEDNPTCRENQRGTVSHFLGDPTVPETYSDPNPPLRRQAWPDSRVVSRYGGADGRTMICQSCHTFRRLPTDSQALQLPSHLVARAGNNTEWDQDPGVYLCTGCHGENPATMGSGHTHPLMNAKAENLLRAPVPPSSATVNGRLNCDSCHTAHGAKAGGGYYILEAVLSENQVAKTVHPKIDYTPLCNLCHVPEKY